MKRGDVVLVDWPFSGGGSSKIRPALIIQNDRDNQIDECLKSALDLR
jgi:mRNA interferase MazF